MLEAPDISIDLITDQLHQAYRLDIIALVFLPLGADVNTAVYRATSQDGRDYFLKLRKGPFDEITVTLPSFLSKLGIPSVIPPLETISSRMWSEMGKFKLILYPYIAGQDGYEITLNDRQWLEFGDTVQRIHTAQLPPDLQRRIPRENYDPRWRNRVKGFQAQVEQDSFDERVASQLAAFMRLKRPEIDKIVKRAERFASKLQESHTEFVLCHSDIHAGNLHIPPDGRLYIVDWDNPIMAPKEHDLMHIGASARWQSRHIKSLFYQGYGEAQLDGLAISYYRCERIIQDIAAFCTQLLSSFDGGKDREQSLGYFTRQFEPGQEVDIALRGEAEITPMTSLFILPRRQPHVD